MYNEALVALALETGFTHAAVADAAILKPMQEVRDMCAANTCHRYGVCWSCPPACGTLEECAEKLSHYSYTLVVQTVGELEDSWDYESIRDTEDRQKEYQQKLLPILREKLGNVMPLGVGSCRQCQTCSYPDAPCRFPEKAFSSMEAYGLLVSQVCTDSGLKYNYGPNTIAYTGCFLF
ncbi:DUF2284 domain-containing protein [Candidatus Avoscillospira sp. LCP25S3_F1]|uniref:DUF2284 domain-containing protein n=1 Tax=Candidatus Avoscillospira sp. LCP25S3_F1 TaxID=3438825 RepID=UPI003F8F3206